MWVKALDSKYLFFTGKGGVGKTSLSCATALYLASLGRTVLIVSTDPASNLDEVLGVPLAPEPRPVGAVPGLFAANLDPDAAASAYREKAVAPYRGLLPEVVLRGIEEQFSGACTTEIAAFDEFTKLLAGHDVAARFDHVVFDTAPTGHTLRMLNLPGAWSGFIDANTSGTSCLGPLAALKGQEALYRSSLETLKDGRCTSVVLVARPDAASLKEAGRASAEMREIGIGNQRLLINGVFTATDPNDAVARALEARGRHALDGMPRALQGLATEQVPLLPQTVVGLTAIRCLLLTDVSDSGTLTGLRLLEPINEDTLEDLAAEVALDGHGVVMTMGKGGVGKTTIAAALAIRLAEMGHRVLLTTTDPAAHVLDAVGDAPANLEVQRIDPEAEVENYRAEVMAKAGLGVDAEGLAVLEEDLRSPCTEEIAVFRAFAEAVHQGKDRFVVLDTAPTGHTVLLLDAAQAYHREVLRTQAEMPESVVELLPRLRDPRFTKVLVVTLPEPTPVHEAARLQEDLRRAGIEPFAWVVNQSFAVSGTQDPLLWTKAVQEAVLIREVSALAPLHIVLPWRESCGENAEALHADERRGAHLGAVRR